MRQPPSNAPIEILWVLDDGASFAPLADLFTTQALMTRALHDASFRQSITTLGRIATIDGSAFAHGLPVDARLISQVPIPFDGAVMRPVTDFDVVFIRVDPPVTERFRHALIQLAAAERQGVLFINSPAAILSSGSKLFNLRFTDLLAPGLVSAEADVLLAHMARSEACEFVAKPLDQAGGRGVTRLRRGDPRVRQLLSALIEEHGFLHLQRFVPQVQTEGEIRHLIFRGQLISAWRKVPASGDYRANLDQGARVQALPADHDFGLLRAIVQRVGEEEPGFVFYSIDTIGPYVNEFNVENVGGLPSANALYGVDHARKILDLLARGRGGHDMASPRNRPVAAC